MIIPILLRLTIHDDFSVFQSSQYIEPTLYPRMLRVGASRARHSGHVTSGLAFGAISPLSSISVTRRPPLPVLSCHHLEADSTSSQSPRSTNSNSAIVLNGNGSSHAASPVRNGILMAPILSSRNHSSRSTSSEMVVGSTGRQQRDMSTTSLNERVKRYVSCIPFNSL